MRLWKIGSHPQCKEGVMVSLPSWSHLQWSQPAVNRGARETVPAGHSIEWDFKIHCGTSHPLCFLLYLPICSTCHKNNMDFNVRQEFLRH